MTLEKLYAVHGKTFEGVEIDIMGASPRWQVLGYAYGNEEDIGEFFQLDRYVESKLELVEPTRAPSRGRHKLWEREFETAGGRK